MDSPAEHATMFGVASVFTPTPNRRKGYARHMMTLLHYVLASHDSLPPFPVERWGPPPSIHAFLPAHELGICSILYSDVGSDFYAACWPIDAADEKGWVAQDCSSTIWDIGNYRAPVVQMNADHVQRLSIEDCKTIWERDANMLAEEFDESKFSTPAVMFLPSQGVAAFPAYRAVFFFEPVGGVIPKEWGIVLLDAPTLTYASWTIDLQPVIDTLIITRIRCTPEYFQRILSAATETAKEVGLQRVEVWNLPEELLGAAYESGGVTEARTSHLPTIAWYGPGKKVKWIVNEK